MEETLETKLAHLQMEEKRLREIIKAQRRLLIQWLERHKATEELKEETEFIIK